MVYSVDDGESLDSIYEEPIGDFPPLEDIEWQLIIQEGCARLPRV